MQICNVKPYLKIFREQFCDAENLMYMTWWNSEKMLWPVWVGLHDILIICINHYCLNIVHNIFMWHGTVKKWPNPNESKFDQKCIKIHFRAAPSLYVPKRVHSTLWILCHCCKLSLYYIPGGVINITVHLFLYHLNICHSLVFWGVRKCKNV